MADVHHARKTSGAAAHRQSVEISTDDLVKTLGEKLGTTLLAFIVDKDSSTITRWRKGSSTPREGSLRTLRVCYQVFSLLEGPEADATIRAWFMGMNPQLDDRSPAEALREGEFRETLAAARAFLAGG